MIKSNQVQYGTPMPGKAVPLRGASGRCCSHEGCRTIVSKYNPQSTCWTHSESTRRLPLDGR